MNSAGSILCTQEAMDHAVQNFAEHVDNCNVAFKQEIMSKVKDLKKGDTQLLTERVSQVSCIADAFSIGRRA